MAALEYNGTMSEWLVKETELEWLRQGKQKTYFLAIQYACYALELDASSLAYSFLSAYYGFHVSKNHTLFQSNC